MAMGGMFLALCDDRFETVRNNVRKSSSIGVKKNIQVARRNMC